jgi:hypothetical protein
MKMTTFQEIINRLKSGWFAQEVIYEDGGFTVYEISKQDSKDTRSTYCIVGPDCIKRLSELLSFTIKKATGKSVCLNFKPSKPEKGCAIIWTENPVAEISKIS